MITTDWTVSELSELAVDSSFNMIGSAFWWTLCDNDSIFTGCSRYSHTILFLSGERKGWNDKLILDMASLNFTSSKFKYSIKKATFVAFVYSIGMKWFSSTLAGAFLGIRIVNSPLSNEALISSWEMLLPT